MGLSLFACGMLYSRSDDFDAEQFRVIIRDICKDLVRNELGTNSRLEISHGEEVFRQYGFSGARGEAESGFRTVFECGMPQLESAPVVDDDALFRCFLAIAANNDDTNILYRQGQDVLTKFKELCKVALDNYNLMNYSIVADYCQSENISPGGSADLLVVAFFIWSVIHAEHGNEILPLIEER
jgi:triphosphoribosyl-dephospho-CoA synthetase